MEKTCIVVVGPTAVGKTKFAIELAKKYQTEIISADSRQCFKELNIGVAKPSAEELASVPHHFINSHSIHEEVNAVIFEQYALEKINEIFLKNDVAIMVGGTGLYVKAFCEGLDELPKIDIAIRENISKNYLEKGMDWLQEAIRINDPLYFEKGEILNPQRLMRALEVKWSTQRSILDFQTGQKKIRSFGIKKIGLELPKDQLVHNINFRVDEMMREGLAEEVKQLFPFKSINALQTVGYKELFEYWEGKQLLNKSVERIKINTRQYAKRQMTWFKKNTEIKWTAPDFNKFDNTGNII